MTIHNFTFAGREWIARQVVNESNTRFMLRVEPVKRGPPFPSKEEFHAARIVAGDLLSGRSPSEA